MLLYAVMIIGCVIVPILLVHSINMTYYVLKEGISVEATVVGELPNYRRTRALYTFEYNGKTLWRPSMEPMYFMDKEIGSKETLIYCERYPACLTDKYISITSTIKIFFTSILTMIPVMLFFA